MRNLPSGRIPHLPFYFVVLLNVPPNPQAWSLSNCTPSTATGEGKHEQSQTPMGVISNQDIDQISAFLIPCWKPSTINSQASGLSICVFRCAVIITASLSTLCVSVNNTMIGLGESQTTETMECASQLQSTLHMFSKRRDFKSEIGQKTGR